MIKSSELRIGNFAYYKDCAGEEFVGVVDEIKRNGRACSESWVIENPTPLTEEWLVKFGFEVIETEEPPQYHNEKIWRHPAVNEYSINSTAGHFFYYPYQLITMVFYVHQLQNLFFALTGTELKTK